MSQNPVISIVEDDQSVRDGTRDLIEAMSFAAETFERAGDFLESKIIHSTSCLIADVHLSGMSGFELHTRLVESGKIIPTILITAFPNTKTRARALQAGVVCYLTKPINESELLACIQLALKYRKTDTTGSRLLPYTNDMG